MDVTAIQSFAEAVADAINARLRTWKPEDLKSSVLFVHCYQNNGILRGDIYRPLDKPLFRLNTLKPKKCNLENGVALKYQPDGKWYPMYDEFERLFGKAFDSNFVDFERIAFTDL